MNDYLDSKWHKAEAFGLLVVVVDERLQSSRSVCVLYSKSVTFSPSSLHPHIKSILCSTANPAGTQLQFQETCSRPLLDNLDFAATLLCKLGTA